MKRFRKSQRQGMSDAAGLSILCPASLLMTLMVFSPAPLAQVQDWPARVRIMYIPVVGKEATLNRYQPLTNHLEKVLGLSVDAMSVDSYSEVLVPLAKGDFEIAYLTPSTYVKTSPLVELEVTAMELDSSGNRGYRGLIICRSDRDIQSLEDVRGKVLAFTNLQSTSGFLVPLVYFLQERKETPESFAKTVAFAGDHQALIKGVLEGTYDAGATNDMDLSRTLQAEGVPGDALRVIWTSELIPGAPVCVRPDLPPSFKAAVLGALVMFNQDQEGTSSLRIGGFAEARDKDYDLVRKLEKLNP